eukprot:gene7515-9012_t
MSTSFDNIVLANMVTSDATGYRILPAVTTDRLGVSLRNAGDFNNDGYDDIILSTVEANNKAGAVYIVFGEPSSPTIITTGEWVYSLNTNITTVDVTSSADANIWVCGGTPSITCVLVNAVSGLLSSKYSFPWDESVSVVAASQATNVVY